jgi:hypothetical protein
VRNVLGASLGIEHLYELARDLLRQFNSDSGTEQAQVSRDEFHDRIVRAAGTRRVPGLDETIELSRFLLPLIRRHSMDLNLAERVTGWLQRRGSVTL